MSEASARPVPTALEIENSKSLDVIYELAREQLIAQLGQTEALDAKAGVILTSSSFLLAALAIPRPALTGSSLPDGLLRLVSLLPLVSAGVYLLVVIASFVAYVVRRYQSPPSPLTLMEQCWDLRPEVAKREVTALIAKAYMANERIIGGKTLWLRLAFVALGVETLAIGILLVAATGL